jgi:hypothetical protein
MVLAGCIAGTAFAQLRMNGWGRAVWVPVYIDQTDDPKTTTQSSYGAEPDLEFMFSASAEHVGVDVGMLVIPGNPGQFSQVANGKVWWKPNNYLKLHIGSGRVDALRGKVPASTGSFYYATGRLTGTAMLTGKGEPILGIYDGDGIFSRFNVAQMGAIAEITPMPGLYLGAAVAPNTGTGLVAEDVYQGIHAVAGYQINDIGLVRVGYIGGSTNPTNKASANAGANWDFSWDKRIEAAFNLTAIPNFNIDFGLKYSLEDHPGILSQAGFLLENPLYLAFALQVKPVDKLMIGFAADGHFAGKADSAEGDAITSAPSIAFNLYPEYDLGAFVVGADITYGMQLGDEDDNARKLFGFGVYAHKAFGHGNVRGGVYYNAPIEDGEVFGLSFPIWITYSF